MKTILITGASGFLGQYILRELSQDSSLKLHGTYLSNTQATKTIPNVTWHQVDLLDLNKLDPIVRQADVVVHAAAIVSFEKKQAMRMREFNIAATEHIVNLCIEHNVSRLVHVSSISALNHTIEGTITDAIKEQDIDGMSEYGKSKYWSEMVVWRGISEGLEANILNPSVILGAGDWSKGSPKTIDAVANGLPFYPAGQTGFVYAKDVAKMIHQLINTDICNERFLCSTENLPYKSVIDTVAKQLDVKAPKRPVNKLHIAAVSLMNTIKNLLQIKGENIITASSLRQANGIDTYDNSKSIRQLGFIYTPIDQAIEEICMAYKA